MIFALPTDVRHRFKLFHMLFLLSLAGLSEKEHTIYLAGPAEPIRVVLLIIPWVVCELTGDRDSSRMRVLETSDEFIV